MSAVITVTPPIDEATARVLRAGQRVLISGTIYTARDAAHQRLCALIAAGEPLPVDLAGGLLYYVGPTPTPPGRAVGSAGPTTAARMDPYTPTVIGATGLRGMIGKGPRDDAVKAAMHRHGCIYLAATGGAAALIAQSITASTVVCWADLGTEAIHRFTVADFPAVVAIDSHGGDLFLAGPARFKQRQGQDGT